MKVFESPCMILAAAQGHGFDNWHILISPLRQYAAPELLLFDSIERSAGDIRYLHSLEVLCFRIQLISSEGVLSQGKKVKRCNRSSFLILNINPL